MVDVKIVAVSVVILLSVFPQPGITAQPTNGSSSEGDSCLQLEQELEFQRVENRRLRNTLKNKQQKINTLKNKQQQINTLENERCRLTTMKMPQSERSTQGQRQSQPATFIKGFDNSRSHNGITKVEDKIYVVNHHPVRISVFEDAIGFRFMTDISLRDTNYPWDIVYSYETKCVYISDFLDGCIWAMTIKGEHRLTKWLTNVTRPWTLSLSNEGHLLVLRQSQSFSQDSLEIYSLNATLIRRLHLPQDIKEPKHVVQTSTGNFIISHRLNTSSGPYVISQLTNDGQLIHRFIPRNQSERLNRPEELTLDSDNNRLFVADFDNHRVILFDSSDLTWSQVLVSNKMNGIIRPFRLFYDASQKHLFVAQNYANITVFEIN